MPRTERLRPAQAADLGEILAIEESWPTTPRWTRRHFEAELGSERSRFLVCEREGRVCGYAVVWKVGPEGQILTIAVKREEAGRGLGRALLGGLLEACRAWGLEKATLEVSDRNARARGLYESAGFQIVGRRPKFYNDGSDAILMDLPLP